jgi:hypothetical protein
MRKMRGLWSIGRESHAIFDTVLRHRFTNPRFESIRATEADATPERTRALLGLFSRQLRDAGGHRYVECPPRRRPHSIRFLDKLPKNAFRVAFLNASFPDAQFIYLCREPRGNISSLIDAWREGRRTGRFVTYKRLPDTAFEKWCFVLPPEWRELVNADLEEIAAFQWASANDAALDDLLSVPRERWHALSYSGLIARPRFALRGLCEFANLAFDDEALEIKDGMLALSRTTLSRPSPDKWKKNAAEIERVLPRVRATAARIESILSAQAGESTIA